MTALAEVKSWMGFWGWTEQGGPGAVKQDAAGRTIARYGDTTWNADVDLAETKANGRKEPIMKTSAKQEYDFAFRRYLEREHSICISANSTDYKPTSREELDDLTKRSIASFERGCALLDALSGPEREQLKQVYLLVNPKSAAYQADELASFFLVNQDENYKSQFGDMMKFVDFVGPRWLQAYLTYAQLRAVFQPDANKLPMVTGRRPVAA